MPSSHARDDSSLTLGMTVEDHAARVPSPSYLERPVHHDVATEAAVEHHLTRLTCTRGVIAHRLSTVRDADLILVMDQGRIVDRGAHDELVKLGGVYAAPVGNQDSPSS